MTYRVCKNKLMVYQNILDAYHSDGNTFRPQKRDVA